jgi:carbamoyl-phosphate synthase large subunit
MKPMNILLTAGSRRVTLVQGFRHALRALGLPGSVIVTDVNPLSPAVHMADRAYRVPMSSDPAYLDEIRAICKADDVRLVIPTIDDELSLFAAMRDAFAADGVTLACSPEPANRICDDKFSTCRHLNEAGVRAAVTYLGDAVPEDIALPLFIKPRSGRGAVGAFPIHSRRELEFFLGYVAEPVVQEMLEGPEYTIDVLCDFEGRPLSIVPRERIVIRSGVSDRGRTVRDNRLIDIAVAACNVISFHGPINIQCRMREGQPVIFEINPRFSGGIGLTIQAGADFPASLVQLALGRRVEPSLGRYRDDLWMTSFESSLFLDAASIVRPGFDAGPLIGEVA